MFMELFDMDMEVYCSVTLYQTFMLKVCLLSMP